MKGDKKQGVCNVFLVDSTNMVTTAILVLLVRTDLVLGGAIKGQVEHGLAQLWFANPGTRTPSPLIRNDRR